MAVVTVAEVAAYLGVSTSAIRQVIRRNGIEPVGRQWKAHLYNPTHILRHTGHKDRLASHARMCHTQATSSMPGDSDG